MADRRSAGRGLRPLLGEDLWQPLLGAGVPRHYRPREYLLHQGASGGSLLVIVEGRVTVVRTERNGSGLLVALRGPGDVVGEIALKPDEVRTASVRALDTCVAHWVSAAAFERFLERAGAHAAFTDYLMGKLAETIPYQVHTAHFPPYQRVARLLLEIFSLAGHEIPDPSRIPLSQEAVGTALGLSRGTIAKCIATLRSDGALRAGPRLVVADPAQLRRAAGIGRSSPGCDSIRM